MDELFDDIKRYVNLRIDTFKLSVVEKLSVTSGKLLSMITFILLLAIALMVFAGALVALVYNWVNSLPWAFVITGAFLVLVAMVFFLLRDRIFTNSMVKMFSGMFFKVKPDKDYDDEEYY